MIKNKSIRYSILEIQNPDFIVTFRAYRTAERAQVHSIFKLYESTIPRYTFAVNRFTVLPKWRSLELTDFPLAQRSNAYRTIVWLRLFAGFFGLWQSVDDILCIMITSVECKKKETHSAKFNFVFDRFSPLIEDTDGLNGVSCYVGRVYDKCLKPTGIYGVRWTKP